MEKLMILGKLILPDKKEKAKSFQHVFLHSHLFRKPSEQIWKCNSIVSSALVHTSYEYRLDKVKCTVYIFLAAAPMSFRSEKCQHTHLCLL